jgi:hypothetical protein
MRHARLRAAVGLTAVAAVVAACGGGHSTKPSAGERDCTTVTQAANQMQIISTTSASATDVERANAGARALTDAAAAATTDVASAAGQLASAARAYASALSAHNFEAANVTGGVLRQRAQSVADICKTQVLGQAPAGPTN